MIWVTDEAGSATYLCPQWTAFTGQPQTRALGLGWTEMVHPDDRSMAQNTFLQACADQSAFVLNYRLKRHGGDYVSAVDAAAPSRCPATGKFLGFMGHVSLSTDGPKLFQTRADIERFSAIDLSKSLITPSSLDTIAENLIAARKLIGKTDGELQLIVDLALYRIGKKLVKQLES